MAGYHQYPRGPGRAGPKRSEPRNFIRRMRSQDQRGRYETGRIPRGGDPGDRRIGVVWHTQGSGKSLTMAFYAGAVIREHAMSNPTVVVLTDRNDLDDQLFGTFSRCRELLRQPPAYRRRAGRTCASKLSVNSPAALSSPPSRNSFPDERGDAYPTLSERRNIVVIADEAHRSQYDFIDGFARHMRDALPNASFVGFTGTPIELTRTPTPALCSETTSASMTWNAP